MRGFLAVAAVLALVTGGAVVWSVAGGSRSESESAAAEELEEETEEQAERTRGREEELERARREGTLGLIEPLVVDPAPGWAGQRLWHPKADDWEPALAGRPGSSEVYMLTTRYGGKPACGDCPGPAIRLRKSTDGGRHWSGDRYLCRCTGSDNQYDPEIEMAADGSLYAAWLDGFDPGVTFARSEDGGRSWTEPVAVDRELKYSDKPIIAISDDGQDVYVIFNGPTKGDAHVAVSHDRGDTFGDPVAVGATELYHFAGGGVVAPDGTVVFAQTAYRQESNAGVSVVATISTDGGQSWQDTTLETMAKQPNCNSKGCPKDFYGPQAAMAGDTAGNLVIAYNGADKRNGNQHVFTRSSTDGGATWSLRTRISPRGANAAFPATVGGEIDDFRVWYMDDRKRSENRWNVWFRESTDGGQSWSKATRISDASSGTKYVKTKGFLEPYGDYGEIAIIENGATFGVWGEGRSYFGPGGTWFNRSR